MSLPTVPTAKRIAAMMHRKLSTHWSEKEVRHYRKLVKDHCFDDLDDLALLERYYAFERRRGDHGRHRRDLITLLNNWQGELDRATAWAELHPIKPKPRVIIQMPPTPSEPMQPLSAEDQREHDKFMTQLRARRKASEAGSVLGVTESDGVSVSPKSGLPRSAFQAVKAVMSGE